MKDSSKVNTVAGQSQQTCYLLDETLNTTFDHFANLVIKDFLGAVDEMIKTQETKYGKFLRLLYKCNPKKNSVLYREQYTLFKENVTVEFIFSENSGNGVSGEYGENVLTVFIGIKVIDDIKDSISPMKSLKNLFDYIKSTIVHEATHFYQDLRFNTFSYENSDLMYWTNFKLTYSSKVYTYIYLTRSEEIGAYIQEAYRFFRKHRKKIDVTFQQSLCATLEKSETEPFSEMIIRKMDIDDVLEEHSTPQSETPYYFAILYIFYVFIPQTRFYYFVEDNPIYIDNKPEEINADIANKNRQRIIKLMYDTSETKKKRQMEAAFKQLASNNTFHKLFSLTTSNARLINKLRKEVLGE